MCRYLNCAIFFRKRLLFSDEDYTIATAIEPNDAMTTTALIANLYYRMHVCVRSPINSLAVIFTFVAGTHTTIESYRTMG